MRAHGLKAPATDYRPARLRKGVPAARLPKPAVGSVFKYLTWHEVKLGAWQAGIGNPVIGEADRRGQYWSDGDSPHSIWVVPLERAPWEPEEQASPGAALQPRRRHMVDGLVPGQVGPAGREPPREVRCSVGRPAMVRDVPRCVACHGCPDQASPNREESNDGST